MTLAKQFYRDQVKFHKRELEMLYSLLDLNDTQKIKLRESTDSLIKSAQQEVLAPEIAEEA